jgi:hypothetical protein
MRCRLRAPASYAAIFMFALAACATAPSPTTAKPDAQPRFGDDVAFLRQHSPVVVLHDASGRAQVVVAPEFQGRVMTSTASGTAGASFGYIKRAAIADKKRTPHINVFGGEDRLWLGPEAGQFGLFFAPGAPYDLEHWQTPEPMDWGAWPVDAQSDSEVRLQRDMQLTNRFGTQFSARVVRSVHVLERPALAAALGGELPSELDLVGYESHNVLQNLGASAWSKDTGLLSIWILGMFNPSPATTIVIPFRTGPEAALGPIVNDAYFGKVPADRLVVGDGVVFYRGDGNQRGKIGISRARVKPLVGAYDPSAGALTIVRYNLDDDATDYVNSMWNDQEKPFVGDVVNSYNDGPPAPGQPSLGGYFELETSSKAGALGPGETLTHDVTTVHLVGSRAALDTVAQHVLGVGLDKIEGAFGTRQ